MATDPTQTVQSKDYHHGMRVNTAALAARLAEIEPSINVPMVTATLDWRIEGTNPGRQPDERHPAFQEEPKKSSPRRNADDEGEERSRRRPARRVFQDQMDQILDEHGPRGEVYESLKNDAKRIADYLDNEVDPEAHGIYVVACSAKGIFETVPLSLPLRTSVTLAPTPVLTELVHVDEDFPTYAVLLADQREARIVLVTHATADRGVEMAGSDYPTKQQQGGWSQRRYQARADERVEAFARDIAEETRKLIDEQRVNTVVLAGDEVIMSALNDELHETVKDKVVDTLRLDIGISEQELIDATLPVAAKAERKQEADAVRRVNDGVGAGTYGAGGVRAVIDALQAGQVETLVMNDDFRATGWADYSMPAFGTGDLPTRHPLGGDAAHLTSVELRDEMVRLAVQTGSEVEIVHTDVPMEETGDEVPQADEGMPRTEAAQSLDAFEGVGAVLRYVVGDEPSEEESAAQAQADRS